MNWLVHLAVAPADAEHRVGEVLADVLRPPERMTLPAGVQAGIASHLRLDAFTDAHPAVHRSRARVPAPWRRYAGVLVDVYYGRLLGLEWGTHIAQPFEAFTGEIYRDFRAVTPGVPAGVQPFLARFADEAWLGAYQDLDGIAALLRGLSGRLERRFGRPVPMAAALPVLEASRADLLEDFHEFITDLTAGGRADS